MLHLKKRTKRIIAGGTALVLVAALGINAVMSNPQTVMAANPTLPGVEEIIYNNDNMNSFVILEIVPDTRAASIGLLVDGEEPVDDSGRSIKNMPGADERAYRFGKQIAEAKIKELGIGNAVSYENFVEPSESDLSQYDKLKKVAIRGEFVNEPGDYTVSTGEEKFWPIDIIWDDGADGEEDPDYNELGEVNARGDILYRKHHSFYQSEDGTGTYGINLKRMTSRDILPHELDESGTVSGQDYKDIYNNQYFVITNVTDDTVFANNDMIFVVTEDENGNITNLKLENIYNETVPFVKAEGVKYAIAKEADGDDLDDNAQYYYVDGVFEMPGGLIAQPDFVAVDRPTNGYVETIPDEGTPEEEIEYVFVGHRFYYLKSLAEQLTFKADSTGEWRFVTDYAKDVYTTATYAGGFTNQEWFKKYIFDLTEQAEFDKMSIDVVTVTMSEFSEELANGNNLLASTDLLYFAGTPKNYATYKYAYTGLSDEGAKALFDAVNGGKATVINRSMFESDGMNGEDVANDEVVNDEVVRKLAACLMHDELSDITGTDNFATLELDALKKTMKTASKDGSLTYVNNNIYVHDDWYAYEDGTMNVVNAGFYTKQFSEDQIAYGFTDVIEEIESENFYLEVAGKTERIKEVATVATAIRHILNSGGRRNVTKTTLRVLDLEPYDFEPYYLSSKYHDQNILDVYEDIRVTGGDNRRTVVSIETDSICLDDSGTGNYSTKLDYTGWIVENIAPQFKNNTGDIKVTIMGTKEFIGKLDDLNDEYDMIYLGMDTSIMNTTITTENTGNYWNPKYVYHKTANTVYNDKDMNGLVYAHMGDSSPVDGMNRRQGDGNDGIEGTYRLSGNDITRDKYRELKEYIEAGYAMVISDGFLKKDNNGNLVVDSAKVDPSSYMYALIKDVILAKENNNYLYYGKNVNSKSNLEAGATNVVTARETFSKYLGISKLIIDYKTEDLPTAWNQPDGSQQYLKADVNGVYHLDYKVKLSNDAAVGFGETTYDCKLYVDTDADGRYEEPELLTGLIIKDSDGKQLYMDGNGHFNLTADDTYTISRELPEGYTGFISWKLLFNQNGRTYDYENADEERSVVRSSITGYSAVPAPEDQKPTINILQITDHDNNNNIDNHNTLPLDHNSMEQLYDYVDDFIINVTKINTSEYIQKDTDYFSPGESYVDFLYQFDMVVFGFDDYYLYGQNIGSKNENDIKESMLALREYTLSGRSIMFTHDLNGYRTDRNLSADQKAWGFYANRLLRDVQGMDRYGWLAQEAATGYNISVPNDPNDANDDVYIYQSIYDYAMLQGQAEETVGLTNASIRNNYNVNDTKERDLLGETSRRASWLVNHHMNYNSEKAEQNNNNPSTVVQVNSGQITEYPFKIKDVFASSHSHPQYLQLNLDTDNRDDNNNDDIVVWYTLGDNNYGKDSFFRASYNDVRNNYFIYNKGNVTYTGSGDSVITDADIKLNDGRIVELEMERKLFVNTLVAAYRSGIHAPRATFKENESKDSATIDYRIIPYDSQLNVDVDPATGDQAFLDKNLEVYFYTSNVDLAQSSDVINAKYYIQVEAGQAYDLHMDDKYYKEILPVANECYQIVESGTEITQQGVDYAKLQNNTMYSMQFRYEDIKLGKQPGSVDTNMSTDIYVRLGYETLEHSQNEIILEAAESFSKLHVTCTQLFELR